METKKKRERRGRTRKVSPMIHDGDSPVLPVSATKKEPMHCDASPCTCEYWKSAGLIGHELPPKLSDTSTDVEQAYYYYDDDVDGDDFENTSA